MGRAFIAKLAALLIKRECPLQARSLFMASTKSELLVAFFRELAARGIPAVILHGFETMPEHWESDVDFVVPSSALSLLAGIQRSLAEAHGWLLVDVIEANLDARYAVLAEQGNPANCIQLDACSNYVEHQHRLVSVEKLLAGDSTQHHGMPVAPPAVEAAYLIAKTLVKRGALTSRRTRLQALLQADKAGVERAFEDVVGTNGHTLADWLTIEQENQNELATRVHRLKRFGVRDWLREAWRAVRRIVQPSGLYISVFGPDGAGKSSLLKNLSPLLAQVFRRVVSFHSRPRIFDQPDGAPNTTPHAQMPRSWIVCVLKLFYYFIDHWLGYVLKILPAKICAKAVIFDRGFEDVLVDPARYRLHKVEGLARCLAALLPKPDITFVLEAPSEVIHQRKAELPIVEITRQQNALRSLAEKRSRWHVVSADQPAESLTRSVAGDIFLLLAERCAKRHPAPKS